MPEKTGEAAETLPPERLEDTSHRRLYSAFVDQYNQNHVFDTGTLRAYLNEHADERLTELLDVLEMLRDDAFADREPEELEHEFGQSLTALRRMRLQHRLRAIQASLRASEERHAPATEQESLMNEFSDLTRELRQLDTR
jgi:hypothetical protein